MQSALPEATDPGENSMTGFYVGTVEKENLIYVWKIKRQYCFATSHSRHRPFTEHCTRIK